MTSLFLTRAMLARPIRVSAISLALACLPTLACAQAVQPRTVAPAPAKKTASPTPVASTQGSTAPAASSVQGTPSGKAGEDVVARVGNINISAEEMRGYLAALGPRERAAIGQDPALLSQAVRLQLANRLALQELLAKKWDQQPGIAAQLDRVRESAVVELYLQQTASPPANYPSDEEVQQVYDANRAALLMPRQFQLAQIFVAAPKDADKATEDKARKAIEDI
jgi:hypothetical protein